jgi:hypothetical protein
MPLPANPRFVLQWEDSFAVLLLYGDQQGHVTADFLEGVPVVDVTGSPVAPNGAQDRFVLNVDNRLVVLRPDGTAVAHNMRRTSGHPDIGPFLIRPPGASTGASIAISADQARFVGRMLDSRIFVVHPDGGVLGYDVIPDGDGIFIQPPVALGGARIATDDDIRFVVGMNFQIILIRSDGSVTSYATDTHQNFLPPVTLAGPKIDLTPGGGDFVVTMGTGNEFTPGPQFSLIVVRRDGSVVGHSVGHGALSAPFPVPMQAPG